MQIRQLNLKFVFTVQFLEEKKHATRYLAPHSEDHYVTSQVKFRHLMTIKHFVMQ